MLSRILKKWYIIYSLCSLYSIMDVIKDVEEVVYDPYSLCLYSIIDVIKDLEEVVYHI